MAQLTLKYWGGRGIAEVTRMMLALKGKPFNDERHSSNPEGLDANLGRMPLLVTEDGVSIGQSAAINYYVASTNGLLGDNAAEAAQVISFAEHIKELREAWGKLVPWGTEPTAEAFAAFFDSREANDYSGPANSELSSKRTLRWFLGRMERIAGDGHLVGNRFSMADVALFQTLADVLPEAENPDLHAFRREPFGSLARTSAVLAEHPKLAKIVANVGAQPGIQKWLATRGKQAF